MADAHGYLIAAIESHGISKIVTMSSFGIESSLANMTFIMRWAIANTSLGYKIAEGAGDGIIVVGYPCRSRQPYSNSQVDPSKVNITEPSRLQISEVDLQR